MSSSDDEAVDVPVFVSDYHFEDEDGDPISFSTLPIRWSNNVITEGKKKKLFIRGKAEDGLQPIFEPVTAWKCDLSGAEPDITVLWKRNKWVKLQKPRKSYESLIRSVLITVRCFHIVRNDPETSGKLLWDQLYKAFRQYEVRPSENDLIDQMQLIEEAIKVDTFLAKSKFLTSFLEERPKKKKVVIEDAPAFVVDETYDECMPDDDDDEDDEDYFAVCAICDNGGNITTCDGICMRSFHATPEDAAASDDENYIDIPCQTLGLSKSEIDATPSFYCKNCRHKLHQCFACGKLGSSDKDSGAAEVFQCSSATCGFFYHPDCVAKLLHPEIVASEEEIRKIIASGGPFTCPCHRCNVCKQMEDATNRDLQFAVCRRCPRSYHRKCLPRRIIFESTEEEDQRAWEGLLPNSRILIYCLKHRIVPELGTPSRSHLKFPDDGKKKKVPSMQLPSKDTTTVKKKKLVPRAAQIERIPSKSDRLVLKSPRADGGSERKEQKLGTGSVKKPQTRDDSKGTVLRRKPVTKRAERASSDEEGKPSLGEKLYAHYLNKSDSPMPSDPEPVKKRKTDHNQPESSSYELDADSVARIDKIMRETESSITLKGIYEKYNKLASTHAHSQKAALENITLGKVEGYKQAIQVAFEKLDGGGNVEEAMAVCEPNVLSTLMKWKHKLRITLAPFLHGMRYTSFGRHFTKVDKLKKIVDMMHCYVEDGDTVVDFCCGANDFSYFMKEKLEQTGKKCSFRNFDLFCPKNDFAFEKRDWMTVKPHELPKGSRLIMGLNPPFGVKASLANKFVNKALEFNPKLIILIVPRETERLDQKKPPYDLVWEDFDMLSGKSFYLPGSINVNEEQMDDWNVVTPVLYLWSRPDFTHKHKDVAQRQGHLVVKQGAITESEKKDVQITDPVPSNLREDDSEVVDMEIEDVKDPVADTKAEEEPVPRHPVDTQVQEEQPSTPKKVMNKDEETLRAAGFNQSSSSGSKRSNKKKRQRENNLLARDTTGKVSGRPYHDNDKRARRNSHEISQGRPHYIPPSNSASIPRSSPLDSHPPRRSPEPSSAITSEAVNRGYGSGGHQPHSGGLMAGYSRSQQPSFADYRIPSRFGLDDEDPYLGGRHPPGWQGGAGVSGGPFDDRQLTNYREVDSFLHNRRGYNGEMDSGYGRLSNTPLYSPDPPPPLSYGVSGGMNMTAMDRYAPRLDELNDRARMGGVGPNHHLSQPGFGGGMYDHQSARPGYQGMPPPPMGMGGYPPVPDHSFPFHNSGGGGAGAGGGWIND